MRIRLLGVFTCLGLLAGLFVWERSLSEVLPWRDRSTENSPPVWTNRGSVPGIQLVRAHTSGAQGPRRRRKRGSRRKRARRVRRPRPARMDTGLRDAVSDARTGAALFWEDALRSVRSARRTRKGRVRVSSPRRRAFSSRRRKPAPRRPGKVRARGRGARGRRAARGRRRATGGARARRAPRTSSRGRPAGRGRSARPDFDGRRRSRAGSLAGALGVGELRLASYRRRPAKAGKKKRARRRKPAARKLSDWLGKDRIKQPTGKTEAPTFAHLKAAFPASLPDGKPFQRKTPPPGHVEALIAPEEHPKYERWIEKDGHRGRGEEPHWHIDKANTPFYHMGKAWGRADKGRWTWMIKRGRRWWAVADGAQRMVRYGKRWWWRTEDGWFLLNGGEPWAYDHYLEWKRLGVIRPEPGTKLVYSADGARVAVDVPGRGTAVFDARTGELLARYAEKR